MPVYSLINPSDPYTMRTRDHQTATVALLLLSEWRIGGDPVDPPEPEGERTPFAPFGCTEQQMNEALASAGIPEGLDAWMASRENKEALAQALDSVLYGDLHDRNLFEAITDPVKAAEAKAKHQDRRSSLNNIGALASRLAEHVRQNPGAVEG